MGKIEPYGWVWIPPKGKGKGHIDKEEEEEEEDNSAKPSPKAPFREGGKGGKGHVGEDDDDDDESSARSNGWRGGRWGDRNWSDRNWNDNWNDNWDWNDNWNWSEWSAQGKDSQGKGKGKGKGKGGPNSWCSVHQSDHFSSQLINIGDGKKICKPLHPCDKAPEEHHMQKDWAVEKLHTDIVQTYANGAKGIVNKNVYQRLYDNIRSQNNLPRPYRGQYPPTKKILENSRAPLVMWPIDPLAPEENFWPQNGAPSSAKWMPQWCDLFGNNFHNLWVYVGT